MTRNGGRVSVVQGALNRAMGPSLGSVCLGTLLVGAVTTAEGLLRGCRDTCLRPTEDASQGSGLCCVCVCCLDGCLKCLRDVMEYFNRWAFTYVAVYGDSFKVAGRRTHALFARRGWSAIVSDQLVSLSFTCAAILVAVVVAIITYFLASVFGCRGMRGLLVPTAALVAFMMGTCVTGVLDAGALTVLVCFAEDPRPCQRLHPEEFGALIGAWQTFFGPELEAAGYVRFT